MIRIARAATAAAFAFACAAAFAHSSGPQSLSLSPLSTWSDPGAKFDSGAAEIVAYDKRTRRIFVVNAQAQTVDVLNAADPKNPVRVATIAVGAIRAGLGAANSVAVRDGLVAVAVEAVPKTDPGLIAFYDAATLQLVTTVPTGALPDAVTFSNNGHFVITSNEGEPSETVDPVGSVTIVDVRRGRGGRRDFRACTAGFEAFNDRREELVAAGVIIDPKAASVAQDLEPEFAVAVGNTAYVTLQENNAIAIVQLQQCRVSRIVPLGFKDHGAAGNGLDTSDRDGPSNGGAIGIRTRPNVFGIYQPDGIAAWEGRRGDTYLIIANEGDVRDSVGAARPTTGVRVSTLPLDPTAFPDPAKTNAELGRLNVNAALGCRRLADGQPDLDATGKCRAYDRLFAYGARSFSILDERGNMIFDSGDLIERTIADLVASGALAPQAHNANHTNNAAATFDTRSDDKGPEPEGVVVGRVEGRTYAFIGLERVGGVMMFDVSNPRAPRFAGYVNRRDFGKPVCTAVNPDGACSNATPNPEAGDLGPEGLAFIDEDDSPNGRPLLVVGNEVSGTTTIFEIRVKR